MFKEVFTLSTFEYLSGSLNKKEVEITEKTNSLKLIMFSFTFSFVE